MTLEEFKEGLLTAEPVEDCPVARTLELLGGRWTSRVIFELEKCNSIRFGELKRHLDGITNTMLSSTLKKLELENIITRKMYDEMPVRVEYSLTQAGRNMLPIFYEIALWGKQHFV